MDLKAQLESHPVFVIATVAFMAGSAVFGCTDYIHREAVDALQREHKIAKDQLEARLAGIEDG